MTEKWRPPDYQAQPHMTPPDVWTLTLNRYQRDNLLRLVQDVIEGASRPVSRYNTGDWVGEIRWMLGKKNTPSYGPVVEQVFSIDEHDRPNPIYDPPPPSGDVQGGE